jgi:hypothetical protein
VHAARHGHPFGYAFSLLFFAWLAHYIVTRDRCLRLRTVRLLRKMKRGAWSGY